jgi:hypothetical protein
LLPHVPVGDDEGDPAFVSGFVEGGRDRVIEHEVLDLAVSQGGRQHGVVGKPEPGGDQLREPTTVLVPAAVGGDQPFEIPR